VLRFVGYAATALASSVATVASMVAIIGYRAPTSFPIVQGIDIPDCVDVQEGDQGVPSIASQERFLDELQKYNGQVVYIKGLTVFVGGCEGDTNASVRAAPDRFKRHFQSALFRYEKNDLKWSDGIAVGGEVTVGFRKVYGGKHDFVLLTTRAPTKTSMFSDPTCGENCYGAQGLYKVNVSEAENIIQNTLTPFPDTGSVIDAYQCTTAKLNAKTEWQRFTACRF